MFFTLSGNILWTYVLPALPAWSLLLAGALNAPAAANGMRIAVGLALSLFLPVVLWVAALDGRAFERPNNQRSLAQAWQQLQKDQPGPLYYWGRRSYSGEFYTAGQARRLKDFSRLPVEKVFYVARRERDLKNGIKPLQAFNCEERLRASESVLFRCGPLQPTL